MVKRIGLRAIAMALVGLGTAVSAAAAEPLVGTFTGAGGGQASWVQVQNPPGDSDGYAIKIVVPSSGSFAGFNYSSPPSTAPATAPSFEFTSTQSQAAGGSPRFVIAFANGDYIYAAPAAWTAGSWSAVGGSASDWYDAGQGGCAAQSAVSYQAALACSHGSQVSSVYLVADTPTAAVLYVDDVRFAGLITTEPGNVLSTQVSRFRRTIKIGTRSGVGHTTLAFCRQANGSCQISMKLTTRHSGRAVTVGRLSGNIAVGSQKRLRVYLNRTGRHLLRRAHTLHVRATGRWSSGGQVHHLRLTLKS